MANDIARLVRQLPGPLLIVLVWALFLPNADFRSLYYEEGRRALLAVDTLVQGHWLAPQVLGLDYINKPPLLPMAMAAIGSVTGGIDEWAVRLPSLAVILIGALLVYRFARSYAGPGTATLAGLMFLLSPMIIEKAALGETDTSVTVASFGAVMVWWAGIRAGRVGLARWLACGALLAVVALLKGPQPIAYFGIGAFLYTVLRRRFGDLPGLILAGAIPLAVVVGWGMLVYQPGHSATWQVEMRFLPIWSGWGPYVVEQLRFLIELGAMLLPWLIPAAVAVVPAWRRRLGVDDDLAVMLTLYGVGCTAALALWPMAEPRYAMPVIPAVAVGAALVIRGLWASRRAVRTLVPVALVALAAYTPVLNLVWMPLQAERYTVSRTAGETLGAALAGSADPVYLVWDTFDHNVPFYVDRPIRELRPAEVPSIDGPAWLIATPTLLPGLRDEVPGLAEDPAVAIETTRGRQFLLLRIGDAGEPPTGTGEIGASG